ncbi:isochorismate synthase [Dysgonomonas sp. 511]|uniref:isochorismate synthase n=1 Tax=Dysgonomonas sp. 511 TaxID=2302930 RepID=UPI0013D09C3B|nr:isochorismate synthase [Dysgonomonas sp. 511]
MEQNQDFDYRIFDHLIENNIRFAVYRPAWQQQIQLVVQTSADVAKVSSLTDLNSHSGFVVAPFRLTENSPAVIIRPEVNEKGEEAVFHFLQNTHFSPSASYRNIGGQPSLGTFEEYKYIYTKFHNALKSGRLRKLVLSRTYDTPKEENFSAGNAFRTACDKYPANFVFLSNTPETGAWMGISPELLVAQHGDTYKTVALAGTKQAGSGDWDDKNLEEQQIVVDYMQQQISAIGCDMQTSDTFTAQAGYVEHLKTKFSFRLKDGHRIGDLLHLLHPSPAVCGFPKEEAFAFINENESYDRRYYSGFVGSLGMDGGSRLYVNLRCMQIGSDILRLYAGGGILPTSGLEKEWEETENKLQTIRKIVAP